MMFLMFKNMSRYRYDAEIFKDQVVCLGFAPKYYRDGRSILSGNIHEIR